MSVQLSDHKIVMFSIVVAGHLTYLPRFQIIHDIAGDANNPKFGNSHNPFIFSPPHLLLLTYNCFQLHTLEPKQIQVDVDDQ